MNMTVNDRVVAMLRSRGYEGTVNDMLMQFLADGGDTGLSAYDVAVANGFTGTESEWLDSLRGTSVSIKGSVESVDDLPVTGENGDAYLVNGSLYVWDGEQFTNAGDIKGPKGDPGPPGTTSWSGIGGIPPTFPPSEHVHDFNSLQNRPTLYPPASHTHSYGSLEGTPEAFPPSAHTHEFSSLTGIPPAFTPTSHSHGVNDLNVSADVKNVLSQPNVASIRTALNIVNPTNTFTTNTTLYNGSQEIMEAKIFTTIVNATDGVWSVDYSHVGFSEIFSVNATGQATGNTLASRNIACIGDTTATLTGASGNLMSATSSGLLAAMTLVNGTGRVHVTVFGRYNDKNP